MRHWRLPRKRKKAFIREFGRGMYRLLSRARVAATEGFYRFDTGDRNFMLAIDPAPSHPVAVIAEQHDSSVHIITSLSLR